jgi:uncharacterized protein (DUF983 family)
LENQNLEPQRTLRTAAKDAEWKNVKNGLGMTNLEAILHQLCPRCRRGRIFVKSILFGWPRMHERCSSCGLKFEREPGYFLGAMYLSYGLALIVIVAIAAILWAATHWSLEKVTIWAILLFLPMAPVLTLFSRVLWIYLDQAIDPEK